MPTSKLQRKVSKILSVYFGRYTIRENTRPDWLIMPTGERLELDFYIEELGIAIEVQGKQHYEFVEHFHQDADGFRDRLERDRFKRQKCERRGIVFIEIFTEGEIRDRLRVALEKSQAIDNDGLYLTQAIARDALEMRNRSPDAIRKRRKQRRTERAHARNREKRKGNREQYQQRLEAKIQRLEKHLEENPTDDRKTIQTKIETLRIQLQKLQSI